MNLNHIMIGQDYAVSSSPIRVDHDGSEVARVRIIGVERRTVSREHVDADNRIIPAVTRKCAICTWLTHDGQVDRKQNRKRDFASSFEVRMPWTAYVMRLKERRRLEAEATIKAALNLDHWKELWPAMKSLGLIYTHRSLREDELSDRNQKVAATLTHRQVEILITASLINTDIPDFVEEHGQVARIVKHREWPR